MDNFTHSLAGWALGQTGLKTKSRKGLAALILGANAPDIDVFFGWVAWAPLATHRGVTHSLVGGVLILPLMLTGLLLLFDRWQVKRGDTFDSGLAMRPGWLLALAIIGAITHPLLDLQTTYAVQLLSPFDRGWFHSDSLFIIDVWIWSALAVAIWLSRRRERSDGNWRRPTIVALGVVMAYIAANIALSQYARTKLKSMASSIGASDVIVASPPPGIFWRRELVWRIDQRIGRANFSPFTGWTNLGRQLTTLEALQPDDMDDPLVAQALRRSKGLRQFMRWSILPIATVTRTGCKATVNLGDGRYGSIGSRTSRLSRETVIDLCVKRP